MILHCHACGWGQDDFWSLDGYHPLREDFVEYYRANLFKSEIELIDDVDEVLQSLDIFNIPYKINFMPETGQRVVVIVGKDYVAWNLIKDARRILGMSIPTWEEFSKNKERWRCPICKSSRWDID